jgi:hypothetical protein
MTFPNKRNDFSVSNFLAKRKSLGRGLLLAGLLHLLLFYSWRDVLWLPNSKAAGALVVQAVLVKEPKSEPAPPKAVVKIAPKIEPQLAVMEIAAAERPKPQTERAPSPIHMPAAARLQYEMTKGGDTAKAELLWQPSGSDYELSLEATKLGFSILKQTSSGTLDVGGLAPTRFADKRFRQSMRATHFQAAKGIVSFSNNRPQAAWILGAQDRLSVLVQLASLAAGDPQAMQTGRVLTLPVASSDDLEPWAFEIQGKEIEKNGEVIKLIRKPRREFDQALELWLASGYGYLPIRIKQTDRSGVTEFKLSNIE